MVTDASRIGLGVQRLNGVYTDDYRIGSRSSFGVFRKFSKTCLTEILGTQCIAFQAEILLLTCAPKALEEDLINGILETQTARLLS